MRGASRSVVGWAERLAGLRDVIDADHHASLRGQIDKAHVHRCVGKALHDHRQFSGPVGEGQDEHLDLALDRVATGAKRGAGSIWIAGKHVDDAIHLGQPLDVYARPAQSLDHASQRPRAVFCQPNGKVATHWEQIVRKGMMRR